jgi:hypothetical protein
VGLELKESRGRLLALIVGGGIVLASVIACAVLAFGGETSSTSSDRTLDTSFTQPASFESIDAVYGESDFTCAATDSQCVRDYLVRVTADYGPEASLGVLAKLQEEQRVDRSVNDHDMAHSVGRETAKDYGSNFQAFDLCPITFNYGCSHGFFEYVLARTDTPKEAATTICESLTGDDHFLIAGFTCYHGVGHGIMMAEAYSVPSSLKACNTLPKDTAKDGCWQGVFMENVNAGMQGRAPTGVFSRKNPLAPCDKVGDRYKHECFINHAGWLMTVARNDVQKGTRYCLRVKGKFRSSCLQSIGLMVTNPVWQADLAPELEGRSQAEIAADLCARFPAAGQKDCVIAGVDNIANFDQLDVTREKAFCEEVTSHQESCYRQIGFDLRARTEDEAQIRESCAGVGAKERLCLAGAKVS